MAFVVAMAVLAGWLYQQNGDTTEVLVVRNPVPPGAVVEESDLGTAQVSGVDGAVPVSDLSTVVGKRALVGLADGQVLTQGLVTDAPVPPEGTRLVALRLDQGRVPDGLGAGQAVDVLAVPQDGGSATDRLLDEPPILQEAATVKAVREQAVDGGVVISLLIEEGNANRVAAYSAAGRVTILQAPLAGE